jgi:beta-glucosidase
MPLLAIKSGNNGMGLTTVCIKKSVIFACLIILVLRASPCFSQQQKPLYQNARAAVGDRVKDLLGRMTLAEKTGQLCTVLGWEMYDKRGKEVLVSEQFKKAVEDQHIGMLWATLRADPWTKKTLLTGLDPYSAALATNALQRYNLAHSRLQIPLFIAEECPHGHMAIGTTVFPTAIGQSSTWNPELIEMMAATIAREARLQGAHIGYGPVLDLARDPRWSRVEETYGEDPLLNSMMGAAMVSGFQGTSIGSGKNVIATLKHFTAYGVAEGGHNGGFVNTGLRELYQSYLPPFRAAVKAGALSVMTAYNSIDGIPCSSNSFLLDTVLRKQWGFKGFTISDLNSINGLMHVSHIAKDYPEAAAQAINAGLDNDLGGAVFASPLMAAVKQGAVTMARIDEAVSRVLTQKFEMGLFENPYVDPKLARQRVRDQAAVVLARKVARESVILLKNRNGLLPLKKDIRSIAVIGPNADNSYNQLGDYTAPQDEKDVVTVLEGIKAKLPGSVRINYVKGCGIRDTAHVDIQSAVTAAEKSDIAIVVLGGSSARDFKTEYISTGAASITTPGSGELPDMESGEGYDRETLDLLGKQLELLKAVVKTGKPVVLVFIGGRPLNLNWPEENVPAIINAWYPGQEGGNAIADVLFGDYNPAGRITVSVPRSAGQLPVYYNYKKSSRHDYVEGAASPLYHFGYGLSYSNFVYSDLVAVVNETGGLTVNVSLKVTNKSARDGDEVVQLYVGDEVSSVVTPVKQLKSFKRINIKAGETKTILFTLHETDLTVINQQMREVTEAGVFHIMVGAGSAEIKLEKKININQNYKL